MKPFAFALSLALLASPAWAESVVIRCPLIHQYSDLQVNLLFNQATSAIGEQEAGRIYSKYLSLRSECSANANASRTVSVSDKLKNWLNQSGVDIRRFASRS
jgi:LPS O-antigen subunit length determinant protein (WzzB/FepE family)